MMSDEVETISSDAGWQVSSKNVFFSTDKIDVKSFAQKVNPRAVKANKNVKVNSSVPTSGCKITLTAFNYPNDTPFNQSLNITIRSQFKSEKMSGTLPLTSAND